MPGSQNHPVPGDDPPATGGSRIPDLPKSRNPLRRVVIGYAVLATLAAGGIAFLLFKEPVNRVRIAIWADRVVELRKQGKLAEVEKEYREMLAFKKRAFGPDDSTTLDGRNNLAAVLEDQQKHSEAEEEFRIAVADYRRVLGLEHPSTLVSRTGLANAHAGQGKYAEAEQEHRAVLAVRERVFGPEFPDVLGSCQNVALALQGQGKWDEALNFARRAEDGWKKTLGPEHPDFLEAKALREKIEARIPGK